MSVITVRGLVAAGRLGVVAPHEHLLLDLTNQFREPREPGRRAIARRKVGMANLGLLRRNPLALRDNLVIDDIKGAVAEARRFRRAGGRTLVDVTSLGLGRNVRALRRISRATGLHIVAGCGYYYHDTHPPDMGKKPVAELTDQMVRDITQGVDNTDIRAGIIGEIGISPIMHPDEKKVLQAAARAQRRTGVPVSVHIFPWPVTGRTPLGLKALSILEKAGADLSKVAIGHTDVAFHINVPYCRKIAARGAFVEFDNFGHEFYVDRRDRLFIPGPFATDPMRVRALIELAAAGYEKQLLVSTDICHKSLLHRFGGWGYDHILTNIVPMLREMGVADRHINLFLKGNPQAFLDSGF